MPDNLKQIKEFSTKPDFGDTDLLLIQGQGTTYNVQGSAVKRYAENAAKPQVELAAQQAQAAADAADRAEAAIVHPPIPDPETGNWMRWDQLTEQYVVTDIRAEGQDFEIRGFYDTFTALQAAVPNPGKGWAYGVGTEPPYEIYIWDAAGNDWKNNGPMTATGDMLKSTYDPKHKAQDVFAYADSVGLPPGGTVGQIPSITSAEPRVVEWKDPPEGVGRSMAGQTVQPAKGTTVTAGEGAEIFNDYRERTFGTDSNPESTSKRTGNVAAGLYSHAEGELTTAEGDYSHVEGYSTYAAGESSHAEGRFSSTTGKYSHAEGWSTASNDYSHSEGYSTKATGKYSHAEGEYSKSEGEESHAEGMSDAIGDCAHAEGASTVASGNYTHSEGFFTVASGGAGSHAEGAHTVASGNDSHAGGFYTIAAGSHQTAIGSANVESTTYSDLFIIGKGSYNYSNETVTRANCFRANHNGVFASGNYNASGADYAELFEWADGNPNNCDWVGRFVTLDGAKIRLAGPLDDYILGIVSGAPSVVGDVYDDQWQGMYLTDIFGRPIWEDVEVPDVTETFPDPEDPEDPENTITRVIIPAHTERRQKLNPAYDNARTYLPRTERPEWAAVGLLGKLVAVEDGTCVPNGWAAVGQGGVATASEARTKYRVMERLDGTHVRIMIL